MNSGGADVRETRGEAGRGAVCPAVAFRLDSLLQKKTPR